MKGKLKHYRITYEVVDRYSDDPELRFDSVEEIREELEKEVFDVSGLSMVDGTLSVVELEDVDAGDYTIVDIGGEVVKK